MNPWLTYPHLGEDGPHFSPFVLQRGDPSSCLVMLAWRRVGAPGGSTRLFHINTLDERDDSTTLSRLYPNRELNKGSTLYPT